MFCMRVMVGVIILYDHVHPVGAFSKASKIDVSLVYYWAFWFPVKGRCAWRSKLPFMSCTCSVRKTAKYCYQILSTYYQIHVCQDGTRRFIDNGQLTSVLCLMSIDDVTTQQHSSLFKCNSKRHILFWQWWCSSDIKGSPSLGSLRK